MGHWEVPQDADTARTYFVHGWHDEVEGDPDAPYRWSNGTLARLLLPNADGDRLELTIDCIPYLRPPELQRQDVWVFASGIQCGFERLENSRTFHMRIPDAARTGSTLGITFVIPNAARPSQFDGSADERQLGLALRSIALDWDR